MSNDAQDLLAADLARPTADPTAMATVADLVDAAVKLEAAVADLEAKLKASQAALRDVVERDLPNAMQSAGLQQYVTTDGYVVSVGNTVRASVSGKRMAQVCAWLRQQGHDGIIATAFTCSFGKGEDAKAQAALAAVQAHVPGTSLAESVHTGTFKALITELLEAGKLNTQQAADLGVFVQRQATITRKS